MTKYNNVKSKSLKIIYNFYLKNTENYGQQIEFMTKHRMFSLKVNPSPLVTMVVPFCMSGTALHCNALHCTVIRLHCTGPALNWDCTGNALRFDCTALALP